MAQYPAGFTPDKPKYHPGFTPDSTPNTQPLPEPINTQPVVQPTIPQQAEPEPQPVQPATNRMPSTPPPAGEQPNPYKPFWDTVASHIPEPVKGAWDRIWSPMTNLPSRAAKFVAEPMMQWGESHPDIPYGQAARYGGAYLQSLGNTVTDLTSPGNVALTAATAGAGMAEKAALPSIAKALATTSKVAGGATTLHGGLQMANPESTMPQRAMGALEAVGGAFAARGSKPTIPSEAMPETLPIQSKASAVEPIAPEVPIIKEPTREPVTIPEKYDEFGNPIGDKYLDANQDPRVQAASNAIDQVLPRRRVDPSKVPSTYHDFVNRSDQDLKDFVVRFENNPNYQTENGQNILNYARDILDERANTPEVPINKELPVKPEDTNLSVEDKANLEAWYKFKKIHDSGKMTDEQMLQWAEVHNKVKDLKPNGTVTISPYRFEGLPPEEPKFTAYTLPDGTEVNLDTSATKGADTTSFQMKDGSVVEARKKFDPSTLGFEGNTPKQEVEFVDPKTGEIKASAEAQPGDVPIIPESQTGQSNPKPAIPPEETKVPGRKRIILTEGPKQTKEQPTNPNLQAVFNPDNTVNQPWSSVGGMPTKQTSLPIGNNPLTPAGVPRQLGPNLPPTRRIGPRLPPRPPVKPPTPVPSTGPIRNILNINKAALTAGDFSAPGRQGKAFILNKAWWTSWDDMFEAWGSKNASDMVHDSIVNHPSGYFAPGRTATGGVIPSFAEKVGLKLPQHEEMFTGGLNKRFGGWIDASSRAHTAFLNKLRSDQFASMMDAAKTAGLDPETNLNIAKAYAEFINAGTGRGSLGRLEKSASVLNDVFFAPRNMAGQIQTWNNVLNPIKYANYDPVLRKQALRSLFAISGVGLGVGELSRMGGAKVSNDPTNSDFRKIRFGDNRIDPFGGYQQFPVAAMKLLMGTSTSSISGKSTDLTGHRFGQRTRKDVAETFFTNRLSPIGSFIYAWMNNSEFDGKPFDAKRALFERVFPIAAKDIYDLAQSDPALAAVTAAPTMFGLTGSQHYTGR
jgi:hypothetical protein